MTLDEWSGPMYRDCGSCNFVRRTYGRAACSWCVRDIIAGCRTLAANLAIGGALCEAWERGAEAALVASTFDARRPRPFSPGCNLSTRGK